MISCWVYQRIPKSQSWKWSCIKRYVVASLLHHFRRWNLHKYCNTYQLQLYCALNGSSTRYSGGVMMTSWVYQKDTQTTKSHQWYCMNYIHSLILLYHPLDLYNSRHIYYWWYLCALICSNTRDSWSCTMCHHCVLILLIFAIVCSMFELNNHMVLLFFD